MLELILCSLFTILPDYLFRRYGQGKRIGHEITLFSVVVSIFGVPTLGPSRAPSRRRSRAWP